MKTTFEANAPFKIYKSLFDYHQDACFALDLEGNFILFNDAAVILTGYSKEEALQMSLIPLILDDCLEKTLRYFNKVLQGNRESFNAAIHHKKGTRVSVSVTFIPIYLDKQIGGIVGIAKNMIETSNNELLHIDQNKVLEMVAKGCPLKEVLEEIVILVENASDEGLCSIHLVNENGTSLILGAAPNLPSEYHDNILNILIGPKVGSCGTAAYFNRLIIASDIANDPLWKKSKDIALKQRLRACWSSPICDSHEIVLGVFGMYYDRPYIPTERDKQIIKKATYLTSVVIQHYRTEEKINFLSFHDELTGLANRSLFDEKVNIAIKLYKKEEGKLLGILYFDLDQFKRINDYLGHKVGDQMLKKVAERIQKCVRNHDLVSRQGSDEFTILLEHVSKQEVTLIANRISDAFSLPFFLDGHEVFITPSIGISLFPKDGKNADELISKADIAMYHAKKNGRNNFQYYNPNLGTKNYDRLEIENELRKAIEKNEFILHYQPIINLSTNKITGVEALIRWENPFRGKVPPDHFIPIAEETGMIIPIGEIVLKKACYQMKKWQDSGFFLSTISVNISIRQFFQPNLVPMIAQIIKETAIDPMSLTIEITESMTMDVETASTILHDLKSLGVNISIDDFGTGYSSLSYLKKFPIDYLKIDRSFISDIAKNKDDENIATTILLMAHNLGLSVIAEGVETNEQLGVLRQHRCKEAQGFLFSKPLPAKEMRQLLSDLPVSFLNLRE
ncbi:EAL domain-containing protein [Neobacillus drentensis]|uniref:sensor domain-containing phosphodiesterase n=1 Tax=Neobacillus drentensis TaxID=220684 RepID=UPI003000EF51